jgi:hypothetical protein
MINGGSSVALDQTAVGLPLLRSIRRNPHAPRLQVVSSLKSSLQSGEGALFWRRKKVGDLIAFQVFPEGLCAYSRTSV